MDVVYEDSDLLVVNKPPGLVIDRDRKPLGFEEYLVVHRLDKETSGLLVLAKTPEALEGLKKQFKERRVKKGYLALVHGRFTHPTPRLRSGSPRDSREATGVIEKPVGRNPKGTGKFAVVEGGRPSVTKYVVAGPASTRGELVPARGATTLLDIQPLTGRTHQIRVHLQSIGHPVVGDKLYASRRQQKEDAKIINRQFLHAYRLSLSHPVTGEWLTFEVDLPKDLRDVLKNFQFSSSNFQ